MAKLNILKLSHLAPVRTHEGGPAKAIAPEQALRRSVLACLLWEDEFYEEGVQIAGRIRELIGCKIFFSRAIGSRLDLSSRQKQGQRIPHLCFIIDDVHATFMLHCVRIHLPATRLQIARPLS